jgi:hypothetical protein
MFTKYSLSMTTIQFLNPTSTLRILGGVMAILGLATILSIHVAPYIGNMGIEALGYVISSVLLFNEFIMPGVSRLDGHYLTLVGFFSLFMSMMFTNKTHFSNSDVGFVFSVFGMLLKICAPQMKSYLLGTVAPFFITVGMTELIRGHYHYPSNDGFFFDFYQMCSFALLLSYLAVSSFTIKYVNKFCDFYKYSNIGMLLFTVIPFFFMTSFHVTERIGTYHNYNKNISQIIGRNIVLASMYGLMYVINEQIMKQQYWSLMSCLAMGLHIIMIILNLNWEQAPFIWTAIGALVYVVTTMITSKEKKE